MVTPSWIRPPGLCGRCGLVAVLCVWAPAHAARAQTSAKYDTSLYRGLVWREVGPFRGGRVTAVAGSSAQPLVYYMGGTGGGVWKTADGGLTWQPVSDKFLTAGSVGALAVAPSDPNVVYAGTGESPIRGNLSAGDGLYKSTDSGKTSTRIGLADVGRSKPARRACQRGSSGSWASPSRLSTTSASGRWSRRIRAGCSARTTAA